MGRIITTAGDRPIRQPTFVPDEQKPPTDDYVENATLRIYDLLVDLADKVYDTSRKVDEYQDGASVTSLEVLPTYELPEIITSVIIVAPAGAVTLQLGNRTWALTVPAAGVLIMSPIAIRLSRHDRRLLTCGTAQFLGLELMGFADVGTR